MSRSAVPGDGFKVTILVLSNSVYLLAGSGAPSSGTSGTYAGKAGPGSMYFRTNGSVYQNTNTKASPTWSVVTNLTAALTGTYVAVVANANVIGGIQVVHQVNVADAASNDVDVVLTHKTRVLAVVVIKTAGAGAASNTITVKNSATAITDAMDMNVADKAVVRAATIDDASYEVAAGGTLRISSAKSGGNAACSVYVFGIRVA